MPAQYTAHPRWSGRAINPEFRDRIKDAACDRWPLSLQTLGIARELLDGKSHQCFVCGGQFRFVDDGKGSFVCKGRGGRYLARGDGFDLLSHVGSLSFAQAARAVASTVGVEELELARAA